VKVKRRERGHANDDSRTKKCSSQCACLSSCFILLHRIPAHVLNYPFFFLLFSCVLTSEINAGCRVRLGPWFRRAAGRILASGHREQQQQRRERGHLRRRKRAGQPALRDVDAEEVSRQH